MHAIAQQLRDGDLGTCAMLVDAECNERYQNFPDAFLPASMQTSRPVIMILQNMQAVQSRRRDLRMVVHG